MTEEIWKPFRDTKYSASNTGLIKNNKTDRILKQYINMWGYKIVTISHNGSLKTYKIHQLVAEVYLNHIPNGHELVVNHIDYDRLNNNVNNLEIITMRENTNKLHIKSSSKYVGVSLHRATNRWLSYKMINGRHTYLGMYDTEEEAYEKYLNS